MGGYGMTNFESYLKERNIPIDSLEANSIQEGMQWAINEACEWLEQHKEYYNKYDAWIGEYVDFNALITDLKKAMEGKHG